MEEESQMFPSQWQALQWLSQAGFATSPDNTLAPDSQAAVAAAEKWMGKRNTLGE